MKKKAGLLMGGTFIAAMLILTTGTSAADADVKATFSVDGTDVLNMTDLAIKEGNIENVKTEEETVFNVVLTDSDGQEHLFEKVDVTDWKDLRFVTEYEMYYLQYTDKDGKSREAEELTEEIIWNTPVSMYAKGSVNVRMNPENEAEAIYYASLGEECQVIGIAPGWFKVQLNDSDNGYIYHKYLTEDKAVIDQLIAEAEAAAAAEAAAIAAAEAEQYSYSAPAQTSRKSGKSQKKECLDNGLLY